MAVGLGDMFGGQTSGTGFLGLPRAQDLSALPDGTKSVLIGVDTVTPYARVGAYCSGGAAAIRAGASDFAANKDHVNFDFGAATLPAGIGVCDAGDLAVDPETASDNRRLVRTSVEQVLAGGAVPILIGGDDSLPYPLLQAMAHRANPVWVVQVDAHLDWRDEVEGERYGLSSPMRRASEMPHVAGIVQIGLRGIGSARESDRQDAIDWGTQIFAMRDVARSGLAPAVRAVPEGAEIVLVFDWDALDPSIMPSVIARTPGGLGYWTAVELMAGLAGRGRIVGASFAEFMASRDIDGQGARVAAQLLITALGLVARG